MSDATLDAFAARDQYKKERDDLRRQNEKLADILKPQIVALKAERDQLREQNKELLEALEFLSKSPTEGNVRLYAHAVLAKLKP